MTSRSVFAAIERNRHAQRGTGEDEPVEYVDDARDLLVSNLRSPQLISNPRRTTAPMSAAGAGCGPCATDRQSRRQQFNRKVSRDIG
jgi:hypothetical protein